MVDLHPQVRLSRRVRDAVLLIAVIFVVINLVVDVIYAYLDPRITYGKEEG